MNKKALDPANDHGENGAFLLANKLPVPFRALILELKMDHHDLNVPSEGRLDRGRYFDGKALAQQLSEVHFLTIVSVGRGEEPRDFL